MSNSKEQFKESYQFSGRNLVIHSLSAATVGYAIYHGELEDSRFARSVINIGGAVLLGSNVWHTMCSYKMFNGIGRRCFSKVQDLCFPSYFTLLHGVSGITLGVFLLQPLEQHPHVNRFRVACLITGHLSAALNAMVLGPTLHEYSLQLTKYETEADVGKHPGSLTPEEKEKIAEKFPEYPAFHKKFARLHGLSMLSALVGSICNFCNVAVSAI